MRGQHLQGLPRQLHPVGVKEREGGSPPHIRQVGKGTRDLHVAVAAVDTDIPPRVLGPKGALELGGDRGPFEVPEAREGGVGSLDRDPRRAPERCTRQTVDTEPSAGERIEVNDLRYGLRRAGETVEVTLQDPELFLTPDSPGSTTSRSLLGHAKDCATRVTAGRSWAAAGGGTR